MKKFMLIALMIFVVTGSSWAATYSGGDGSEADPYKIATTGDLIELSNTPGDWGERFILTEDITFNANEHSVDWDGDGSVDWDDGDKYGFSPIGNNNNKFEGKFNGKGHKISNLYIHRTNQNGVGLFGRTGGATIENIGIVNCNITGCYYVGGLVGYNLNNSRISNSYSTGSVSGSNFVGGLVGVNTESSRISNSYSTGTVSGTGNYVGGLVGRNYEATVSDSYSTGTVSGNNYVGGLVGDNFLGSTISDSYSRADVTRKSSGSAHTNFGGFCGHNENATIEYCYSTGKVLDKSNNNLTGKGFVGNSSGTPTYQHNFFDKNTSGQTSTAVGTATAKTTADMKDQSTFPTDWTFGQDGIWTMDPDLNDGYPAHQWADNSGPSVKSFSPENGASEVSVDANLVITFDEEVVKDAGKITLYKSDDSKVQEINVADVTIEENKVTINLDNDLEYEENYYVQIEATCFNDAADNGYAGINDKTTWTFVSKFEPVSFKTAEGTTPADIRFVAVPVIDANKTVDFIGFQLASNYGMTQNIINLKDNDAEARGYILLNWNDYIYGNMYYYRYAVIYTDGTEDYGPVSAFIRNEGTGVIKIGE